MRCTGFGQTGYFLILCTILLTQAEPVRAGAVSEERAARVAKNHLTRHLTAVGSWNGARSPLLGDPVLVKYDGFPVAYHFPVLPQGHILVPYWDAFSPVLLYSTTSGFDPARVGLPHSVESWVIPETYHVYQEISRIRTAYSGGMDYSATRVGRAWAMLDKDAEAFSMTPVPSADGDQVGPLLTTRWDQEDPYYLQTPEFAGACAHTLTGCVATAWSQLMKYWHWPDVGTGSHSYVWWGLQLSADFEHVFPWMNMPNILTPTSLELQKDAVAQLMSDAGISADTDYGCDTSGSTAVADDVLDLYFKYQNAMQRHKRDSYPNGIVWFALFKAEFDAHPPRPVVFSIFGTGGGGHETVADGYLEGATDMVHINLGWAGSYDGYYDVTNNFTTGSYAWRGDDQIIVTNVAPADGTTLAPAGDEHRVNTETAGNQNQPAAAGLAGGGFLAAWTSDDQDGDQSGVFAQVFDEFGRPKGDEFQVNTYTAGDQQRPRVAALSNGGFVVVYESMLQDGSSWGVFVRRYDSDGNPVGAESQVNTNTTNQQYWASAAPFSGDGFMVVWQSDSGDGDIGGIFGQCYDGDGAKWGGEFQINTYATSYQVAPDVAPLSGGGFVVAWQSNISGSDEIRAQRFDSAANKVGTEFQVNTTTANNQMYPAVAGLPGGRFAVMWHSYNQDGDSYGVYGQVYRASGEKMGGEFRVNQATSGCQWFPDIAPLPGGGFLAAWDSYQPTPVDAMDVLARKYDHTGAAVGGEFRINSDTASLHYRPSLAVAPGSAVAAIWTSSTQDGSGEGIYVQRYGHWQPPRPQMNPSAIGPWLNLLLP